MLHTHDTLVVSPYLPPGPTLLPLSPLFYLVYPVHQESYLEISLSTPKTLLLPSDGLHLLSSICYTGSRCRSQVLHQSRFGCQLSFLSPDSWYLSPFILRAGPTGASYYWSAPEQLCGYACMSASDVFSFGVVMWELCTGEAPANRHLREIQVPEEAPQEIVDLIMACRNPEPTMRPTSVEVHAAIRRQTY